ncbi:MAG: cyclic nucleotide-binding domain-containing protein [Spirochaetales bacterium]|nr:cyclic nucleotide-binding domain-containing protein [Spirochaetales bacterium]
MPERDLRLVLRVASVRRRGSQEQIIREGSSADSFYIIRRGQVAITKRFQDGQDMVLAVHGEGDFFGEMALLDEGPRSASAVALEPAELLEISRRDFTVLLRRAPLLAYAMMRELSSRLRGTGSLLVTQLERKNAQLEEAYRDTLRAVVNALEARDRYNQGHTERVNRIAKALARRMGLSDEELFVIEIGALLHDVGKIAVPDAILNKEGPLGAGETLEIREHPSKGMQILANIAYLKPAIPCVLHHHERFDGSGYPERMAGEEIPLAGRIIAVADAFDAMTHDRPYRRAMSWEAAAAELAAHSGQQFDPAVVAVFQELWDGGELARVLEEPPAATPGEPSPPSPSAPRSCR